MTPETKLLRDLVEEAPVYFAPQHDFEGRKGAWIERANIALTQPAKAAEGGEVALKVYKGEICYKSQADDQSFGMWCPVAWDTEHGYPDGTAFYTTPPASQEQAQQPSRSDLEAAAKVCDGFAAPDMAAALRGQQPSGGTWVNFDLRDITHNDPGGEPGWVRVCWQQPSGGEVVAVPDECPHVIWFDDADMAPIVFAGAGAKTAAEAKFKTISGSWNASLFVRIASNSHDDPFPSATLATPKPEPMTQM